MTTAKGNKIELKTFQGYGKSDIIGFKTLKERDRTYVNFTSERSLAQEKSRERLSTRASYFLRKGLIDQCCSPGDRCVVIGLGV